jgi:phage tail-like protein
MDGNGRASFIYLNRDNGWPLFHWSGLELGNDGTLRLDSVPILQGDLPPELAALPSPTEPAGTAVGPDGTVYFSDPAHHRLLKIDACDGTQLPIPCVGGEGERPTQFRGPRGLLFHPLRRALFVADSGNGRIQIFEPDTFQLLDIWGQPGVEPGRLDRPWSMARDTEGDVYVVDYGNRRVQKFDFPGNVIPTFWERVQEAVQQHKLALRQPSDVAVGMTQQVTQIYILDGSAHAVFVFDKDGQYLRRFGETSLQQPMGLAVGEDACYIGDNRRRRVLRFKHDGTFVGEARGYEGPVAALALDERGGLLVHPGSDRPPVRLAVRGGYVRKGWLWGGPFENPSIRPEQWHWLKARIDPLLPGSHIQLFVYTSPSNDPSSGGPQAADPPWSGALAQTSPVSPHNPGTAEVIEAALPEHTASSPPTIEALNPAVDLRAEDFAKWLPGRNGRPNRRETWIRMPLDVAECMIPGTPSESVWVGAEFSGEGLTSPVLSQMRLEFDHETYLQFLPAIYHENARSRQFLARFLSLFESLFSDVEGHISDLAVLFDPAAAPAEFLAWLAGWLAVDLRGEWSDAQMRQAIAEAFEMYAQRGTVEGLQLTVRRFLGADVRIEEPILHANWWALARDETSPPLEAGTSLLGFTTMLAPAEPQGAVVGTTAVLDASHLIAQEEFGVPLFQEVAHRFTVQLYRGRSYSNEREDEVRALVDREKPAHTAYHLCVIEPRMRVGLQARIGIDTIIAGPPSPMPLGQPPHAIGEDLVLGGDLPGRVGERSQVGRTTRLGEGAIRA